MTDHARGPRVLLAALLLVDAGCSGSSDGAELRIAADPNPHFLGTPVTTELRAAGTVRSARPLGFARDPASGAIFVADGFLNRVLVFDSVGMPLRSYGTPGRGRERIAGLGDVFVTSTDVIALDFEQRQLVAHDRASGAYRRTIAVPGETGGATLLSLQGHESLLLGLLDRRTRTIAAFLDAESDSIARRFGQVPDEYLSHEPLQAIYSYFPTAVLGDTLFVGPQGLSQVSAFDRSGRWLHDIMLPVRARRGQHRGMPDKMTAKTFQKAYGMNSALVALGALHDSSLAAAHADLTYRRGGSTAQIWVSRIGRANDPGCVDIAVKTAGDGVPVIRFDGDTMFVLEQRLVGGAPHTMLSRFPLNPAACTLGRARATAARRPTAELAASSRNERR